MKTTFKFNNPDEMDATLSITMSMKRWKELRAHLGNADAIAKLQQMGIPV